MGITEDTVEYLTLVVQEMIPDFNVIVKGQHLDFDIIIEKEGFKRSFNVDIILTKYPEFIELNVDLCKYYIERDMFAHKFPKLTLDEPTPSIWELAIDKDYVEIFNVETVGMILINVEDLPKLIEWLLHIQENIECF